MRHETRELVEKLLEIERDCRAIRAQAEDLDLIAFERRTTGLFERVTGTKREFYLDEEGSERAKRVLRALRSRARQWSKEVLQLRHAVFALFAGPGADSTLRGTLISEQEFKTLIANQAERRRAGEGYTPEKVPELDARGREKDPQPTYPKAGR